MARSSPNLPRLVALQIVSVLRVFGIMFFRSIGILRHLLKRQRLDGVAGGGEERAVLAIAPGREDEAALPAGGQWWQFFGVKLYGQFVAGAEGDKPIVAVAQQFGDFTVARHFSCQARHG